MVVLREAISLVRALFDGTCVVEFPSCFKWV
jgi:hypothetical protein